MKTHKHVGTPDALQTWPGVGGVCRVLHGPEDIRTDTRLTSRVPGDDMWHVTRGLLWRVPITTSIITHLTLPSLHSRQQVVPDIHTHRSPVPVLSNGANYKSHVGFNHLCNNQDSSCRKSGHSKHLSPPRCDLILFVRFLRSQMMFWERTHFSNIFLPLSSCFIFARNNLSLGKQEDITVPSRDFLPRNNPKIWIMRRGV